MNIDSELRNLVDRTLNLEGRTAAFTRDTPLIGAVPEMDSMGVVSLLTAFEERLGLSIDDDEVDGAVFATWGSLLDFVSEKLQG